MISGDVGKYNKFRIIVRMSTITCLLIIIMLNVSRTHILIETEDSLFVVIQGGQKVSAQTFGLIAPPQLMLWSLNFVHGMLW